MPAYWTGTDYRWRQSPMSATRRRDLDTLAKRLQRAYYWGSYGTAWGRVEYAAYLVIVVSLVVIAATVSLP